MSPSAKDRVWVLGQAHSRGRCSPALRRYPGKVQGYVTGTPHVTHMSVVLDDETVIDDLACDVRVARCALPPCPLPPPCPLTPPRTPRTPSSHGGARFSVAGRQRPLPGAHRPCLPRPQGAWPPCLLARMCTVRTVVHAFCVGAAHGCSRICVGAALQAIDQDKLDRRDRLYTVITFWTNVCIRKARLQLAPTLAPALALAPRRRPAPRFLPALILLASIALPCPPVLPSPPARPALEACAVPPRRPRTVSAVPQLGG